MSPRVKARAPWAALTLIALWLPGCATMRVNSYLERGIDLRQYHTYQWGLPDDTPTGDPRLDNNRFFDEHVRAQVEKELERRGFRKATSGQPELLVHYHASVSEEIDVRELDRPNGYCAVADCRPYIYDKGTLFVDLVEPGTARLIWRGWAESSIDGVIDNQAWMEARIDEAVAKILTRLPPRL
jgi:Domain of unknown function (DUF4136)